MCSVHGQGSQRQELSVRPPTYDSTPCTPLPLLHQKKHKTTTATLIRPTPPSPLPPRSYHQPRQRMDTLEVLSLQTSFLARRLLPQGEGIEKTVRFEPQTNPAQHPTPQKNKMNESKPYGLSKQRLLSPSPRSDVPPESCPVLPCPSYPDPSTRGGKLSSS